MENYLRPLPATDWTTWEEGELNLSIKFKDSAIMAWKFMFGTPDTCQFQRKVVYYMYFIVCNSSFKVTDIDTM